MVGVLNFIVDHCHCTKKGPWYSGLGAVIEIETPLNELKSGVIEFVVLARIKKVVFQKTMTEYILASKSPRRKSLLRNLIDGFMVINPDIEEARIGDEHPENFVLRISKEKARAASEFINPSAADDWVVIAADTIVVDGDLILGKPTDRSHAVQMLTDLRGKAHTVYSGLVVYDISRDEIRSRIVSSEVWMREYTDIEVKAYVASGDPMDKAGAYAIQNQQFDPAPDFCHCYANVMGLPLCHLAVLLNEIEHPGLADVAQRCQDSIHYQCPIFSQILMDRNGKEKA